MEFIFTDFTNKIELESHPIKEFLTFDIGHNKVQLFCGDLEIGFIKNVDINTLCMNLLYVDGRMESTKIKEQELEYMLADEITLNLVTVLDNRKHHIISTTVNANSHKQELPVGVLDADKRYICFSYKKISIEYREDIPCVVHELGAIEPNRGEIYFLGENTRFWGDDKESTAKIKSITLESRNDLLLEKLCTNVFQKNDFWPMSCDVIESIVELWLGKADSIKVTFTQETEDSKKYLIRLNFTKNLAEDIRYAMLKVMQGNLINGCFKCMMLMPVGSAIEMSEI